MVLVAQALPRDVDGRIDIANWCEAMCRQHVWLQIGRLFDVCRYLESLPEGQKYLERGFSLAELVASLKIDNEALIAALLYRPHRDGLLSIQDIETRQSDEVAALVEGVSRMATANFLDLSNTPMLTSERQDQVENVRRMLITLVDDARVAVIKIAERVVALREAKQDARSRRSRIALEARHVFAPLAGRLGIRQLKWELEDLAMRYLEPEIYSTIAGQLDGKRIEREAQIATMAEQLRALLLQHGVETQVLGRAKHIYSIWRKMQSKQLGFDQVYDMRAVRVLVEDLASCYAALGVVHTTFRHIPSAFDDYIASPKENGYRSIHTAVIGADGKHLEVQIRTQEMNDEAELGVCAHWSYKGDGEEDRTIGAKMEWLRHVVEWHEELGGRRSLGEEISRSMRQERIYLHTPKGHVIDLVGGATPIDFAYRVHTDIGHRCAGARVDGREVSLNYRLRNGERVEILTAATQAPRRLWLEPEAGYVRTHRARSKIQSWMRARGNEVNRVEGLAAIDRACQRLHVPVPTPAALIELASALGEHDPERLFVALGIGECPVRPLIAGWLNELAIGSEQPATAAVQRVLLVARNRHGLLLDVTRVVDELGISLQGSTARVVPPDAAEISLEFLADDLIEVYQLVENLRPLVGVTEVRRDPGAA